MAAIIVKHLSKEFKIQERLPGLKGCIQGLVNRKYITKTAVDDISFEIDKGEIVGYIGPNGAGKSTTIKMLSGILVPSKGVIKVNGIIPHKNRIENTKKIGVVFGQRTQLWWDIPIIESYQLMKHMYKIPNNQYEENINFFSNILGLGDFFKVPVRQLSLGQRMRADLCAALLHNPDILYLDEPTIGLDVVVKDNIRKFIKEINLIKKTTIILTTHDMADIEKLCSRVMVIDRGKLMYDGNLQILKNRYGTIESISAVVLSPNVDINKLYLPGVIEVKYNNQSINIKYDKTTLDSVEIIKKLMDNGKIKDLVIEGVEIDEVIRAMYKEQSTHKEVKLGV
ncbi:ABC transporter ATP-binding protein [Alkaliphilus peptidifermentans]|uniref:ABC-2 type transport system ATP-binding protein n=1 Tax=Alkaliphilus peptidifermentans DSM 18978 TaxID=1120976 RepID=A0A1G5LB27_9FIRM|nr:ATP-binding cassette domain-containing protein [Alkaliphilus peptidifermentans]SCZ09518.1 ABC-2 type transport system ATP-binding protein [Alkaliphilus peptidifermentans DSM 18978]